MTGEGQGWQGTRELKDKLVKDRWEENGGTGEANKETQKRNLSSTFMHIRTNENNCKKKRKMINRNSSPKVS